MRDPRTQLKNPASSLKLMRCAAAVSGVHKSPARDSAIDDQLLWGHGFHVAQIQNGWAYGQVIAPVGNAPSYTGYVLAQDLVADQGAPSHKIAALKAPLFSAPDIKSEIRAILSLGSQCIANPVGDFFKTDEGFIHTRHISPVAVFNDDFVRVAERYLGMPYIWGGKSGDGVDCSGLVQSALWACGIDCPRDADQQEEALGQAIAVTADLSQLQRGDLVFWRGHVGIMMDAKTLLHANAYHMMSAIEPLATARSRIIAKTKIAATSTGSGDITAIKRLVL